jgi:NNMT/PNMT/TEMT family
MVPKRLRGDVPLGAGGGTQPAAPTASTPRPAFMGLNGEFPWDEFDSRQYYDHNYKVLRDDDRQIVEIIRNFFATLDRSSRRNGIDVGSGTNLYPALAMLPLCDEITLYEYSTSNVSWLQREIKSYAPSWDDFWELLAKELPYKLVNSPRETLAAVARIERGSIFDLPESRWDVGTMFFTAESISATQSEFRAALTGFIRSLRTGAPFAAAFMENSVGYDVGARRFPAVAITVNDVKNCLEGDVEDLEVHRIGLTNEPLRAGYDGMILVTGKVV